MQTVSQRLALLRQRMALRGLDACVVVTDDFHGSEYVGDHFKTRAYLSGFTGSAGTLLVLAEEAYLWTDGRYFLQAERQLTGSGIALMRAGQPGVPTLSAFLAERLPEGGALGFDGRTVSTKLYRTLEKALADKRVRMDGGFDPAEGVWSDRPPLSAAPVWAFDSGVTRREKLALLRQDMAARDAAYLLLTDLTDAAWTLELRGGDVACTPVFLGFLLLGREEAVLCAQAESFPEDIRRQLAADGVALRPYGDIYALLETLPWDEWAWGGIVNCRWFERVCVKDIGAQEPARGKDGAGQEALAEALAAVLGTSQTLRELCLDGVKLGPKVGAARRLTRRRCS